MAADPRPVRPARRVPRPSAVLCAAALVAAAFFGMEHFPAASTTEDYAPSQEEMEAANTTADPGRRVALLGLIGLGAVGVWKGKAATFGRGGLAGWVPVVWLGWLGLTFLWSEDPRTTIRRLIVLAAFHLAACGVCKLLDGRRVVKFVALAAGLQLAVGVLAELGYGTFRPWSGEYRFAGTIHPNMQAAQLSVACVAAAALAAFGRDWTKRVRWAAAAAVLFGFLFLTKSRTSTGAAVLAVVGVLVLSIPPNWKRGLALPAGLAGCVAVLVLLFGGFDPTGELEDAAMMGRSEQATSLSGRVPIWAALDPYVERRWWAGWGYSAFWSKRHIDALVDDVGFTFSGAHSAWYEAALEGGMIGVGLMGLTLLVGLGRSAAEFVRDRGPVPAFAFGALVCVAVNSLLEALFCDTRMFPFLVYCGLWKLTFLRDPPAPPAPVEPAVPLVPEAAAGPAVRAEPAAGGRIGATTNERSAAPAAVTHG